MDKFTDKNFLESVSYIVRVIRTLLTSSNMVLMCFILLSLNYSVVLSFQALDQRRYRIFFYNFLMIIPRLMYCISTYYGFFGSFRCSSRYLRRYLFYSIITIAMFFIFAIYWFALGEEANSVQFGRRRFILNLDDFKKSGDNCTKSTVGYRRLNRFMKDYDCCDWDENIVIDITDNISEWNKERTQCARQSFFTCQSNRTSMAYCVDKLNRVVWISYFDFILYASLFFFFVLNLFSVYLRREILFHRMNKEHKTYTTII